MKDTEFMNIGIVVFFAIDNFDFLDTRQGQCTLHDCFIVVIQEEDENTEPINLPLVIPGKTPSNPPHVDIKYKDEPVMRLTPRVNSYKIGQ